MNSITFTVPFSCAVQNAEPSPQSLTGCKEKVNLQLQRLFSLHFTHTANIMFVKAKILARKFLSTDVNYITVKAEKRLFCDKFLKNLPKTEQIFKIHSVFVWNYLFFCYNGF